jgi:hypothetical protein
MSAEHSMVLPLRGDDKTMYRRRTGAGGRSYAAPKRRSSPAAKVLAGCVGEGIGEAKKIGAERGREEGSAAALPSSIAGRASIAPRLESLVLTDEIELATLSRSIAKSPDLC